MRRAGIAMIAALLSGAPAAALPPLLVPGDEPAVSRAQSLRLAGATIDYEAITGRIPIRHDETGQVRGRIFFTYYRRAPGPGQTRPITFLWNGGPTVASLLLHLEMFGPRRIEGDRLVNNMESLLEISDLVFYDPVGTGFSRPEDDAAAEQFYGTLGDFAATAEFIRAFRARFAAEQQPLFIGGESYGTWRAGGVAEKLSQGGLPLEGALLISGGIPGMGMSDAFSDAMFVPARTAAALHHRKLSPVLMRDPQATIARAARWARETYRPALERLDSLSAAERETIAADLALYTGIGADRIDRSTLVVSNRDFLNGLVEGRRLDTFDMRLFAGDEEEEAKRREMVLSYYRDTLGYRTDLAYTGLEDGYMPQPGPARRSTGSRWNYDHVEITPAMMKRAMAGGGPPGSQPWLQRAMRSDPGLRVFVAAGRFDSLNMCEGNVDMVAALEPALARRFTTACYAGGHMMYRDAPERLRLTQDIRTFYRQALGDEK